MRKEAQEILQRGTVIPAMPLVLTPDRTFDEARQRRLIRYYLEAGVGGLAVAVHTTQFAIRDEKVGLFEKVIQVAADEIAKWEAKNEKVIVKVCGVCGEVNAALKEAELARNTGYDVVLLSPNGLNHLSELEHLQRAEKVSHTMPVIGFYLQSAVGGKRFSASYWKKLCEIENVVAIKAAPFSRYGTLDIVRAVAETKRKTPIALYTGNDDNIVMDLLTTYDLGEEYPKVRFVGGLLGHWAVWTHKVVELYQTLCTEREKSVISQEMLTLASQVTDANAAFFDSANQFAGCITGIHEVLRRQGLLEGIWTLDPQETLSEGQAEEISRVRRAYPHLADDDFVKEFLQKENEQSAMDEED